MSVPPPSPGIPSRLCSQADAALFPASASPGDIPVLSSVLLDRARSIAAEHQQLVAANVEKYDVGVAKKIGELGGVVEALKEWEDAQNVGQRPSHYAERWT